MFSLLALSKHAPIRGGKVLLLLEALLQAHELQLGEHGAAPPALLCLVASVHSVVQLPAEVQVQRQMVGRGADLKARARGQKRGAEWGAQGAGKWGHGELE